MSEQPRVPAGSPKGGEWTSKSGSGMPAAGASYVRRTKRVETSGLNSAGFPEDDAVRQGDMNPEGTVARVIDSQRELDDETSGIFYDYIARGDYQEMNNELRKHPKFYKKEFDEHDPEDRDHPLTRKMSMMQEELLEPLSEPVVVYRGTALGPKATAKLDKPGAVLRLAGFQSTSVNPATATSFSMQQIFEIKAIQGRYLKDSAESEVLLPHGAKFRVIGKKRVKMQVLDRIYGPKDAPVREVEVTQLEQVEI